MSRGQGDILKIIDVSRHQTKTQWYSLIVMIKSSKSSHLDKSLKTENSKKKKNCKYLRTEIINPLFKKKNLSLLMNNDGENVKDHCWFS